MNNTSKIGTKLYFNYIDYNNATTELINEFSIKQEDSFVTLKLPWKSKSHQEPILDNELFIQYLKENNWKLIKVDKIEDYYKDYIDWQKLLIYETWVKY